MVVFGEELDAERMTTTAAEEEEEEALPSKNCGAGRGQ